MKVIYKTILTKIDEEILSAAKNKKEIHKIILSGDEFTKFSNEVILITDHLTATSLAMGKRAVFYNGILIEVES